MNSRTARRCWATGVALFLLAGCGAPDDGTPVTITRVPYDLTSPSPGPTGTPDPEGTARPYVYLVREDVVVPVKAQTDRATQPSAAVTDVLAQLTEGPSERERAAGLSTALGPGTALRLRGLAENVATVDLTSGDQAPAASRVPLAVAQVVLTVTSVPGVDRVRMTRDGQPLELPLPGGALTGSPVGAHDYLPLTRGPTPSPTGTMGSP